MTAWRLRVLLAAYCLVVPAMAAAQDPHAGHSQNASPAKPATTQPAEDHSAHTAQSDAPREPIPPLTDADRAAAFPSGLEGHATHDSGITTFVLFDQFEWQGGADGGLTLENTSWVGGGLNRVWLRAEGESEEGRVQNAQAHVLYGRSFSRWWDFVVGVRQDFRPGPAQTWAAVGVQGLAPYWFDVQATGYFGNSGAHARLEVEYEVLFTNRLILQPLVEVEFYSTSDPGRGIGSGLSSLETGLRLRYEVRRELAPYVGVSWHRKLFGTADLARAGGEQAGSARLAFGVRTWF